MKRQHILSIAALAMLVLLPLLATAQQPATTSPVQEADEPQPMDTEQPAPDDAATSDLAAAQEVTDADATWETDDRIGRAETGTLRGTVVLIDPQNLIVETAEGDRAFAIDADTRLPDVLTDENVEWDLVEGFPVEVTYRPGDPGELRIVDSLSVLPVESQENGAAATTASTTPSGDTRGTTTAAATTTADLQTRADAEERTQLARASTLPSTASPLPWIGLAGLLALGGAFALRRRRPTRQS
ncbi:MAG TPA: LPXTG cell wall anchor domain-containing protein [Thermoanaerobaculia bacterium]|nr:LPXTG cell wall anchor domain-containing protein [Thermoanaerobaculia bacterium]